MNALTVNLKSLIEMNEALFQKLIVITGFSYCVDTKIWFFGSFYGKPGSKSLKALLCGHFIQNMGIIVYNPCPIRVLL